MIFQLGSQSGAAFSPCGRWLATGNEVVTLWDLRGPRRVRSWPVPSSIAQLAFSPDGAFLAARAEYFEVSIFDLATHQQVGRYRGNGRVPRSNAFAFTDADHLIECSYDGSIYRFARTGEFFDEFTVRNGSFAAMRRVGDEILACVTRESSWWGKGPQRSILRLSASLKLIEQFPVKKMQELKGLAISDDRKTAWVVGLDDARSARLVSLSLENGKELAREACADYADTVELASGGEPIVSGYKCFEAHYPSVTVKHEVTCSAVHRSPDRKWLIVAGYDGSWLLDRDECERRLVRPTTAAEWASVPPIPVELSQSEIAQMALPEDLRLFLAQGRQWEYDTTSCHAGRVVLHGLGQLVYSTCGVTSYDTDVQDEDPAGDEDGWYLVPMVSLVAKCEDYGPQYLLTWLPEEKQYGTYDVEHRHLRVFPGANWADICADPARYVNSQWDAAEGFAEDARPWLIPGRSRTM